MRNTCIGKHIDKVDFERRWTVRDCFRLGWDIWSGAFDSTQCIKGISISNN